MCLWLSWFPCAFHWSLSGRRHDGILTWATWHGTLFHITHSFEGLPVDFLTKGPVMRSFHVFGVKLHKLLNILMVRVQMMWDAMTIIWRHRNEIRRNIVAPRLLKADGCKIDEVGISTNLTLYVVLTSSGEGTQRLLFTKRKHVPSPNLAMFSETHVRYAVEQSRWNLICTLQALFTFCNSNFKAMRTFRHPI